MTALTQQLPAYPYQQYASDPNIVAFFDAYNQISQGTATLPTYLFGLNQFNALNLPNYRIQSGDLLNWIGLGLYGESHNALTIIQAYTEGPLDTYPFNELQPNQEKITLSTTSVPVNDAAYIRIIQWNNFKGDGFQFSLRWLKRRVWRFLTPFGYIFPDETYSVSVTFTGPTAVDISVPLAQFPTAQLLQAAVASRVVLLPFQYTFTVTIT